MLKYYLNILIFENRLKNYFEDLFFGVHLRLCPWSLALASRSSVLGRAVLGLELCVLDSTSAYNFREQLIYRPEAYYSA